MNWQRQQWTKDSSAEGVKSVGIANDIVQQGFP